MLIISDQENLFALLILSIIAVSFSLSLTVFICCSAKKEEKPNIDGFTDDPRPKLTKQKSKKETATELSSKKNKSAEAKSGETKSEKFKKFKKEETKKREEPSNKEERKMSNRNQHVKSKKEAASSRVATNYGTSTVAPKTTAGAYELFA